MFSMNNVAILNFLYNYIYKNKQGVGHRIHEPNNEPFPYYRPPKIIAILIIVVL